MGAAPSYSAFPIINVDATNGSDTAPPSWLQGVDGSIPQVSTGPYTVASVVGSTFTISENATFSAAYPDGDYTDIAAFVADATAGAANFVGVTNIATAVGVTTLTCDRAVPATWATGSAYIGQQLTLASLGSTTSKKLLNNNNAAGDALAGWSIKFLSGHTETITANLIFKRAGSAANGPITLQGATTAYSASTGGVLSSVTRPIITFSNNGDGLTINNYCVVKDFNLANSNGTKTAARAIVIGTSSNTPGQRISGMKISAFGRGITCDAGSPGSLTIENCWITTLSGWTGIGYGILLGNNNGADYVVQGCWIDNVTGSTGGTGIAVTSTVVSNSYMVEDTIVSNCVAVGGANGHGIHVSGAIAVQAWDIMNIRRCVFYANQGDGYRNVAATATPYAAAQSTVENCQFVSNAGYGINFSSTITAVVLNAVGFVSRNNNYYLNTTGTTNPASIDVNAAAANPRFRNPATGDFRSLALFGYPNGSPWLVGSMVPGIGVQNTSSGSSGRMSR